MIEYSAGIVTAYGSAVRAGYTGTYEDFCRQQAQYADNASAVEQAKQTAVSASQSADQAKQDAQTASTTAQQSAQSAQGSAQSAGQSAQDAQTAKNNAQTYAQSASQSAGSAQQSAQSAQAVLESIPEDYSDLSKDVDDLKADLGAMGMSASPPMEQGVISSRDGTISDSTTRLYSRPSDAYKVTCDSGYKFVVVAYSTPNIMSSSYVGVWNGTTFEKSATWFTGQVVLDADDEYYYAFVFANNENTAIEPTEAEHLHVTTLTDKTLSKKGRAADSKIVGDAFETALMTKYALTSADDLNDVTIIGVYAYNGASLPTNAPTNTGGTLVVCGTSTIVQRFYFKRSNSLTGIATRIKTNQGWLPWLEENICDVIDSTSDLNNIIAAGAYGYSSSSIPENAPTNTGATLLVYMVKRNTSSYSVVQIACTTQRTYIRIFGFGGNWGKWTKLLSPEDILTMTELPVLELTGDITNMTKDVSVTLDYALFGMSGTCTCKWQGSSSVRYAKKNYTIKLDTAMNAMSKFVTYINNRRAANGNISRLSANASWGNQTKYNFKANYIDPSMMRNIVCARLWAQIVKSRVDNSDITDGRATAPAYGAIDGFPCEIKINGESAGLYTMNIPKDKWMFDMGNVNTEYLVSGEDNASNACRWKATAELDESDFSLEYAAEGVDVLTVKTSLNTAIQAAINAGADWETTLAPYVDIDSVFDYFIFTCCINNHDALARNILYGTYDGVKWFMSAYDMDTTFGVDPYGTLWFDVVNDRNQFAQAAAMHRLAYLMYTHSKAKLKARYQALRSTVLSDANVFKELSNFAVLIPQRDYDIDREIWQSVPGTSTANIPQYMEYYRMHCTYLDSEIDALVN